MTAKDDGNVAIKLAGLLQKYPIDGLSDPKAKGAEDLRAAVDLAVAQQRQRHFIEPWRAGTDEIARDVYAHVNELMTNNRPALTKYARLQGFRHHQDQPPGAQRSSFLDHEAGTWYESRYKNVPQAPPDQPIQGMLESGSRFQNLPEPPRRKDGTPDFDAISKMHHGDGYTGPGGASRGRPIK
jgi:hypothetical protein